MIDQIASKMHYDYSDHMPAFVYQIDNITSTIIGHNELNLTALFLLLIPAVTVFGNFLVVISVCRERTLKSATNYLIVSMACADLLVAILVMPFAVYVEVENGQWKLPKGLCTVFIAIDVCASTASILNLVSISWDRYMAISKPIEYSRSRIKNRRVFLTIIAAWLCSLIVSLPIVTGANRLDDTPYCEFTNPYFILISSFVSFIAPCLVMVILYGVVLHKLRIRQFQIKKTRRNQIPRLPSYSKKSAIPSPSMGESNLSALALPHIICDYNTMLETTIGEPSKMEDNPPLARTKSKSADRLSPYPKLLIPGSQPRSLFLSPSYAEKIHFRHQQQPDDSDDEDICSDFASSISQSSFQLALSSGCVSPDRKRSIARSESSESEGESVPFIDGTKVVSRKSSTVSSVCNGALDRFIASVSLSSHVATVLVPAITMDTPQMRVPEIKLESCEMISSDESKDINENNACGDTLKVDDLNHYPLRKASDSRRPSAVSITALAMRVREMAATSKEAVIRSARRRAAARYSKQCRKERKATYMLAVVLVVFLACWIPFFTCHISNAICILLKGDTCISIVVYSFTTWLGYTNSFMNPIIYTIFNPEYRRAFKNLLQCRNMERRTIS